MRKPGIEPALEERGDRALGGTLDKQRRSSQDGCGLAGENEASE
jgi:hypothetical protein